jgi:hypothetical protein
MVDYIAWSGADPLTVEQAAHLWAGVDPSLSMFHTSKEEKAAVAPRLQMIVGAIVRGALKANASTNPRSSMGNHDASLVAREDLMVFARALGEKPAFLFDTMLNEVPKAPPSKSDQHSTQPPKNKGGRPAQYDWNCFTLEIIRIAHLDGLPDTQAELANKMRDWFISEIDSYPADTTLEDRIRPIYQYLEKPRKPPAG